MPTAQTRATLDPDVVCTELGNGETVLLHLGTQAYFSLNETGARIWQLMDNGLTLGDIAQAIEAQFDVSFDRAQGCVIDLASDLANEKLVSLTSDVQKE